MKVLSFLKKHSGIILTVGSSVGVVVTSVLSARCTTKYNEIMEETEFEDDEKIARILTTAKIYSPAIISGTLTIVSIFANHRINDNKQKALIAAYAMLSSSFSQFKEAAKKVYGEDAVEKINIQMAKERYVYTQGMVRNSGSLAYVVDTLEEAPRREELLFYEPISKVYFNAKESQVYDAIIGVNHNFALSGWTSVNDWLDFLGLQGIGDEGDIMGWDCYDEVYSFEISPTRFTINDGEYNEIEGIILYPMVDPVLHSDLA